VNSPTLSSSAVKASHKRWNERVEKIEGKFSVFSLSRQLLARSKKWTVYRTRKKWDFWISGSYNHEEPGSTESITAGIEGAIKEAV
jgi:hypothetical protein